MGMDCSCLGDLVLPSSCCVCVVVVSVRALWRCSSELFVSQTKSTTGKVICHHSDLQGRPMTHGQFRFRADFGDFVKKKTDFGNN
jgi:hypothetical protein